MVFEFVFFDSFVEEDTDGKFIVRVLSNCGLNKVCEEEKGKEDVLHVVFCLFTIRNLV